MILRIVSSRIVGLGGIVGRSACFSLNLSDNSVTRGRVHVRRTFKGLVANLRISRKLSTFQFAKDDYIDSNRLHKYGKWVLDGTHDNDFVAERIGCDISDIRDEYDVEYTIFLKEEDEENEVGES